MMITKKVKWTRKVIIQNPRLRAIRDALRTILKLAVIDEYKRLRNLKDLYSERWTFKPPHKKLIRHKLNFTQLARSAYLWRTREYLEETFKHSICACSCEHCMHEGISNVSIEGDRVRYSLIEEFQPCFVKSYGGRYELTEVWYLREHYEEFSRIYEQHLYQMKLRMDKFPSTLLTPYEIYQQYFKE